MGSTINRETQSRARRQTVGSSAERQIMGMSPSADLFFGYVFNEEGYPWQGDDYDPESEEHAEKADWDDEYHILHAYGIDPEPLSYQEIRKALEEIGVELCAWGSLCGDHCYYIRPIDRAAYYSTSWDGPTTIPTEALQNNDAHVLWIKPLEEFAKKMGIDLKGQVPKWHLVASFG